jgi:hypothetical protein
MTLRKNSRIPALKQVQPPADDTLVSDAILQQVVEAVSKNVRVDRSYEVPYLGGSSRSGTIYIDRRLPRSFRSNGRRVAAEPFIVLHEAVERAVGDRLGLRYQHAHQIALRTEEAAVRAAGISWQDYNAFMQKYEQVAQAGFSRLPPDLDLKPYRDENDADLLRRIREARRAARSRRGRRVA